MNLQRASVFARFDKAAYTARASSSSSRALAETRAARAEKLSCVEEEDAMGGAGQSFDALIALSRFGLPFCGSQLFHFRKAQYAEAQYDENDKSVPKLHKNIINRHQHRRQDQSKIEDIGTKMRYIAKNVFALQLAKL